jgi:hypothetical protein
MRNWVQMRNRIRMRNVCGTDAEPDPDMEPDPDAEPYEVPDAAPQHCFAQLINGIIDTCDQWWAVSLTPLTTKKSIS